MSLWGNERHLSAFKHIYRRSVRFISNQRWISAINRMYQRSTPLYQRLAFISAFIEIYQRSAIKTIKKRWVESLQLESPIAFLFD